MGSGGAAGSFGAGGPYSTTGTAGSAGGPQYEADAATDGPRSFGFDGNVMQDVSHLGGAACGGIEYPATGFYGENFIFPSYSWVTPGAQMEMAAKLGQNAAIKIRMTLISGSIWNFTGSDWRFTKFDMTTGMQTFQASDPGRTYEEEFSFPGNGRALVEYFECGSATATGSKLVLWGNGISDSGAP